MTAILERVRAQPTAMNLYWALVIATVRRFIDSSNSEKISESSELKLKLYFVENFCKSLLLTFRVQTHFQSGQG